MNMGGRVKLRLKEMGNDQAWLRKQVGMSAQALSQLIKRDSKMSGKAAEMARALKVHAEWLASGRLPKLLDERQAEAGEPEAQYPSKVALETTAAQEAYMDNVKAGAEMLRAWMKLPEKARMRYKQQIEAEAVTHSAVVPDQALTHLARPDRAQVVATPVERKRKMSRGNQ